MSLVLNELARELQITQRVVNWQWTFFETSPEIQIVSFRKSIIKWCLQNCWSFFFRPHLVNTLRLRSTLWQQHGWLRQERYLEWKDLIFFLNNSREYSIEFLNDIITRFQRHIQDFPLDFPGFCSLLPKTDDNPIRCIICIHLKAGIWICMRKLKNDDTTTRVTLPQARVCRQYHQSNITALHLGDYSVGPHIALASIMKHIPMAFDSELRYFLCVKHVLICRPQISAISWKGQRSKWSLKESLSIWLATLAKEDHISQELLGSEQKFLPCKHKIFLLFAHQPLSACIVQVNNSFGNGMLPIIQHIQYAI